MDYGMLNIDSRFSICRSITSSEVPYGPQDDEKSTDENGNSRGNYSNFTIDDVSCDMQPVAIQRIRAKQSRWRLQLERQQSHVYTQHKVNQ